MNYSCKVPVILLKPLCEWITFEITSETLLVKNEFLKKKKNKTKAFGGIAGIVDRTGDSWSGGFKFKPHIGH